MEHIVTISIILFAVCCAICNKYKLLFFLTFYTLTNDMFMITAGPAINLAFIIIVPYIPIALFGREGWFGKTFGKMSFLYYELGFLLVLGILLGFIFPWTNVYDSARSWSQLAGGRTIISIGRLTLELLIIPVVYYWMKKGNIDVRDILKIIGLIVILNFSIAIVDFFSGNMLKACLFPNERIVVDRFSGFCGEPRSFGRGMAIAFIILVLGYLSKYRMKWHLFYIAIAGISVLISFSASAAITLCLALGGAVFIQKKIFSGKVIVSFCGILVLGGLMTGICYYFDSNLADSVVYKIEKVFYGTPEDQIEGEPALFTRLEVFDRAALNFLYNNPKYFLFGTGPNLISIPASDYLSPYALTIYKNGMNSVPHTGFVNILARSGIAGLLLYLLFFKNLYNIAQNRKNEFAVMLILAIFIFFMMIKLSIIYVIFGVVIALIEKEIDFAEYNNTCS